jgi:hypothetical protein
MTGRFEYLPSASHQYTTMMPGQVELLVEQFDRVTPGMVLYRMDSPLWRDKQQGLAAAIAQVEATQAALDAIEPQRSALGQLAETLHMARSNWTQRLNQLQAIREAGGGRAGDLAQVQSSLAATNTKLAELASKTAALQALQATTTVALRTAITQRALLFNAAASLLDTTVSALQASVDTANGVQPRWRTIETIDIPATSSGVVDSIDITSGAWVKASDAVLSVVKPDALRFHADGLQSDLGVLRDGLTVRIVPPSPSNSASDIGLDQTMSGTLTLGPNGNADHRTIDVYVRPQTLLPWARAGVSAHLEVITDSTGPSELAIPLTAVQRDGLEPIIFRRDSGNPNQAIRMEADLGLDDGRWVAVLSGLADGDEVVLDGGFQLMLATSGTIEKGGHFHSDGTFHEGEH